MGRAAAGRAAAGRASVQSERSERAFRASSIQSERSERAFRARVQSERSEQGSVQNERSERAFRASVQSERSERACRASVRSERSERALLLRLPPTLPAHHLRKTASRFALACDQAGAGERRVGGVGSGRAHLRPARRIASPGRPRAGSIARADCARTRAAVPTFWPTAAPARISSTGKAGREAVRAGTPGSTGTAGVGRARGQGAGS